MAIFTVQFGLGPETRALVERLVERATMRLEVGPETRELIAELIREMREPPAER